MQSVIRITLLRKSHQPLAGVQQKNSIPCKGNSKLLLFRPIATCGRGQDRLVRQRSLQSCLRSQGQRSPSSGPVFLVLFDVKHAEPSKRPFAVDVLPTLSQKPHWRMPCTLGKLNISLKKSSTATACSAWVNCVGFKGEGGFSWHSILISSVHHYSQVNWPTQNEISSHQLADMCPPPSAGCSSQTQSPRLVSSGLPAG